MVAYVRSDPEAWSVAAALLSDWLPSLSVRIGATAAVVRSAAWNAQLEGKWALQKAMVLEGQSREQLIRSVLRWWKQGDLARAVAQWRAWSRLHEAAVASPHVRVNLAAPKLVAVD